MASAEEFSRLHDALARLPAGRLRCCTLDPDLQRLTHISPSELSANWANSENELWVDIRETGSDQLQDLLEALRLHPLIVEDCLDPYRSARFSSYESSLHLELPVLSDPGSDNYLCVLCVPRTLVTIRTNEIPVIDELLRDLANESRLIRGTKSALLYAVLDSLGEGLIQAARHARSHIHELSQGMDSNPNSVDHDEIISIKREFQNISMIAEDQLYCVRALLAVDSSALQISEERDYWRDAVRNYETALRVVHRYEARASELHQQYIMSLQAKTESRIRILTILSSICMPLTLIAGIYGMNFASMPELRSSWGYPITLGTMAAIAIGQLVFFYGRGWLE